MKKLIGNKKGVDAFTFILTIIAISVLVLILVGLTSKYNNLKNTIGGAGSSASLIISTYDRADGALLYLDNAVGLSMQDAVYDLAYNGFSPPEGSGCGVSGGYVMWSKGVVEPPSCEAMNTNCVPGGYEDAFKRYFSGKLEQHVKAYNEGSEVKLHEDNYELYLGLPGELFCSGDGKGCEGRNTGLLQLVGRAEKPISVNSSRVNYTILPSFRENGDVDLIGDFGNVTSRAEGLVGQDSETMENSMESYTEETGLKWNVDSYNSGCGLGCNNGEACEICNEVCEDVEVDCDGEEESECTETVCETVCYPGVTIQYYCKTTADIGVKIPDENYKKGNEEGYKGFVTSESENPEVKEYSYRFGLNWVELQDGPVCVLI